MIFSDEMLQELREMVAARISEKRFSHILGVERCAKRLGDALLPSYTSELRAAAILHDVSKEFSYEEQLKLLEVCGTPPDEEDKSTPGVLHSFTAPCIIRRDFPAFATDNILSAVYNHTIGAEDMSVFDKIIFISDYIEDTRTYQSCVEVRNLLFEGFDSLSDKERKQRLDEACLASINGALEALLRDNRPINSKMYKTKNSLIKNKFQS